LNALVRAGYSRAMTPPPPIPDVFRDVILDLPELAVIGAGSRFQQCFGCGPSHETGLRVRCFLAEGEVLSPIVVPRRYEGPPGAVHGGIVAAYLDEVLAGAAVQHTGRMYVTGELSVRYVKPTPIERPLRRRGQVALYRRGGHPRGPRHAGRRREGEGPLFPHAARKAHAGGGRRFLNPAG
jgi:uncharacterized protein (TIGR00369 family)